MCRWVPGLVVGFASLAAHAAPPMDLQVERSSGAHDCPSQPVLASRVEAILGRSLESLGTHRGGVAIYVRFTRGAEGYAASLQFDGERTGERHLQDAGRTCDALAEAVSISVALVMERRAEPSSTTEAAAPNRSPATTGPSPGAEGASRAGEASPTTGALPRADTVRRDTSAVSRPSGSTSAALTTVASVAAGPGVAFAADVSWMVEGSLLVRGAGHWELGLGLHRVWEKGVRVASGSVVTSLWFASAQACAWWGRGVRVRPCAAYGLGQWSGEGEGFTPNRSAALFWNALGATLETTVPLGRRTFLAAQGGVWMPLRSLTFSAQNAGILLRAPPIAGALTLGFGVELGGSSDSQMAPTPSGL